MRTSRLLSAIALLFLLGRKLSLVIPEAGTIVSNTGMHDRGEGDTCVIDIDDGAVFSDTFIAVPQKGFFFTAWEKDKIHF